MIAKLLARIFGTKNERELKKLQPIVNTINSFEPIMQKMADDQLAAKTNEFREQLMQGKTLDDILPEAFAVVRETAKRKLGQRHFDVQLMGGIVLHQGKIAEMKTGEGKTLTATLPLYLNALSGKGAHLVTVNDYLARRDAAWMEPIYSALGLTVATLQHEMNDQQRKEAYNADILYATNNELGFDYLRDNMKFRLEDYVQRDLNYAIVDEVDSILIDEARTPLIISGSTEDSSKLYEQTDRIVRGLVKGVDYEVDEKERNAILTESGVDKVEHAFNIQNLYAIENIKLLHHVTQALKAHALFRKDVEYVVANDQVMIVDEFTGRILSGRRYSDGLHQAIEAKEHVTIQSESQTLASITLQNYFRLYKKLAGMTGTAATDAEEFYKIYKLEVVSIPTNTPCIRQDKQDLIFLSEHGKFKAIVEDVKERHKKGQPVLIGTVAVEKSEKLSAHLNAHGIPHEVLNAKHHQREAEIVAHAGEPGRVTIATNMAGRGTDIKLAPASKEAGGLYILGTERHESRRIDNQLRGRSGRQGDPGESRFYIALDDELIRRFAGDTLQRWMSRIGMTEEEVIEDRMVSKTIEASQEKVEKQNFDIRKHLLEYDDVLNQQRSVIYAYRRSVLENWENIFEIARDMISDTLEDIIAAYTVKRSLDQDVYNDILHAVSKLTNIPLAELHERQFDVSNSEIFKKDLIDYCCMRYELLLMGGMKKGNEEEQKSRTRMLQEAQKWLMLEAIDQAWKQHMLNLDNLKEGIHLRGWGQKNPLIEYKRESFILFEDMMRHIRGEIVSHLFRLNVEQFDKAELEARRIRELEQMQMQSTDDTSAESSEQQLSRAERRKKKRR
jgi:preprotein translocase subunit SecA